MPQPKVTQLKALITSWLASATAEADKAQQAATRAAALGSLSNSLEAGEHRGRERALRQAAQELRALIDRPAVFVGAFVTAAPAEVSHA